MDCKNQIVVQSDRQTGSNAGVVVYATVVFATAWMDGRVAAVNARPAINFAFLLAAKKYAPDTDTAIAGNAGSYNR